MSIMLSRPDGDTISHHNSVVEAQTVAASLVEDGVVISWNKEGEGRYVGTVGAGMVLFVIEESVHGHA